MTTQPTGAVILVIDDLPANRRLMQAILTPHGYQVVEASPASRCLALLAMEMSHLALTGNWFALMVMLAAVCGLPAAICARVRRVDRWANRTRLHTWTRPKV